MRSTKPSRAYLSGAMEHAPDGGRAWREGMEAFLGRLGHTAYNPARDVRKNLTDEEVARYRNWKASDPARFRAVVRKIIHHDLDILERDADYVICLWDEWTQRGGGTHGELTTAFRRGIPVFMVTELPLAEISGWIQGCCTEIFPSLEALQGFLRQQYGDNGEDLGPGD
jgi:hypothetical protein